MINELKQAVLTVCIISGLVISPSSYATEANGTIEEIRVCGTGTTGVNWVRYLAFKVEGKWFGTYAEYYGSPNGTDNNIHSSVVLMAFSTKNIVQVVSQGVWNSRMVNCGLPTGNMLNRAAGEFISIKN